MNTLQHTSGGWAGSNGFRLMPDDELSVAPSEASVASEAQGWGVTLRYTWVHPEEGPQEGTMLISSPDDDGQVVAAWIDSYHQKPALGLPRGTASDAGVHLAMEYSGWGWTIDLTHEGDALRMVMNNVIPEGVDGAEPGPYVVMDAEWTRVN